MFSGPTQTAVGYSILLPRVESIGPLMVHSQVKLFLSADFDQTFQRKDYDSSLWATRLVRVSGVLGQLKRLTEAC